jgi:hypothetical protein
MGGAANPFSFLSQPSSGSGFNPISLFGDGGIGSLLGNLFSESSSNSNTSGNQTTNSNTNGTSTTARTLSPGQSTLLNNLLSYAGTAMNNPSSITAPFQQAARDSVDSTYGGLAQSLQQQFLSTGGGTSGKYGIALEAGNLQRLGGLASTDQQFAQENALLPLSVASSLGSNLLNVNLGSTTTGSSSSSGNTTANSTTNSSSSGFKI